MIEKKKKREDGPNKWAFLAVWVGAHVAGWGLLWALLAMLNLPEPVGYIFASMVIGIPLAFGEDFALKRYLDLSIPRWRLLTLTGSLIGWLLVGSVAAWFMFDLIPLWVLISLLMLPFMLFQMFLLRKVVRYSLLWLLAGVVSAMTFSITMNARSPDLGNFGAAAIMQGIVTGFVMLWLSTHWREKGKIKAGAHPVL